ncbi:ABC transporter ATP-binding protein [Neoactinobaculum massilliense]|uniref:ABC transporter ATP-binding protein n=1 Tax=Neoactinobaculum massilliense TaxID=2364794 RepID=UPI000F539630|nr:ABC transporter ATP-binding protein [Neoactinobaculum massilliense]
MGDSRIRMAFASIRQSVRGFRAQWAQWWAVGSFLTLTTGLVTLLLPVASYLLMVSSGSLVDAVTSGGNAALQFWILAGSVVGSALFAALQRSLSARLQERTVTATAVAIAQLAVEPASVRHLENPEIGGRIRTLVDNSRDYLVRETTSSTWTVWSTRLSGIASVVLLLAWQPVVAVLLVAGMWAASVATTTYITGVYQSMGDGAELRRSGWYQQLATRRDTGRELRLFGLTPWAIKRSMDLWRTAKEQAWAQRSGTYRRFLGTLALITAITGISLAWLIHDAWIGLVSAGSFVALIQAIMGTEAFGPVGDFAEIIARGRKQIEEIWELGRKLGVRITWRVPAASSTDATGVVPARGITGTDSESNSTGVGESGRETESAALSISIQNLSFSYPGADRPVLDGLNLAVPAGQSLAIVGVNGSGKSTLMRLLSGLERPSGGTIRVAGHDPIEPGFAPAHIGMVLQNFTRLEMSVRDNIVPALAGTAERDRLALAGIHRAGAEPVLDRVGSLDRVLSAAYPDGTDLSGGQWQRIALARALARVEHRAGLLILDEPTSALDVRAEAELFARFLDMPGETTRILVTHRLSSVREADRIVVLDGGRITEDGTHEELMAHGGLYADMFTTQAARFQAAGNADEDGMNEDGVDKDDAGEEHPNDEYAGGECLGVSAGKKHPESADAEHTGAAAGNEGEMA